VSVYRFFGIPLSHRRSVIGQPYCRTPDAVSLFSWVPDLTEHDTILILVSLVCLIAVMEVAGLPAVTAGVRKRPTGIVGLNLLLEGGFPEGTLIMVHGTAVAGVDLAAQHFCNCNDEEYGTYICPEEMIEAAGPEAKMNPATLLEQMKGNRIVVDSLSAIIQQYGIEQTLFLLSLARDDIKKNNANLMFIIYSGVHTPMEMTRIMRVADVVIELKTQVQQAEIARTLAVQKIKGAAVPRRLLPFIITDNGIEASTTSRVV
jgi:KaiC/GvpD/RAD55 family RecA-like ATPase